MTDQEYNEAAATEVMGWFWSPVSGFLFKQGKMELIMSLSDFDPLHDWAHAGLLLEKMVADEEHDWSLALHVSGGKGGGEYASAQFYCPIDHDRRGNGHGSKEIQAPTATAAITRAAVDACVKEKDATD